MIFEEYSHMDNDYKILKYDKILEIIQSGDMELVALEKIHGTNFSFITDGTDVVCCRRSDILKPDENFYSYKNILAKFEDKILNLFNKIKKMIKEKHNFDIIQIQLYGELYGGNYPGVETSTGSKSVQKGIYYSNSNDFAAFDLKYWIENNMESNTNVNEELRMIKYLDWDEFEIVLQDVSIPIVPVISKGKWNIISQLNPKFESVVYKLHNLPQISSNYAEGYVIKPIKEVRYGKNNERLIWKFKNPSFSEISKDKNKEQNKEENKTILHLTRMEQYVNENRFNNVVSKIVEGTKVDKVVELFYSDIWTDFIDDLNISNIELEKNNKKELEKKLRTLTNRFVRTRYFIL